MGIQGFTKFINDKFNGWEVIDHNGLECLVIDGDNICCYLYSKNHPWKQGGEYLKYYSTVEKFFKEKILGAGVKNPVVIFDGSADISKLDTICKRRKEANKRMDKLHSTEEWCPDERGGGGVMPLMILNVAMKVLQDLEIRFFVGDPGVDGDKEIAIFANEKKCPVLAYDSDYFVFKLNHGYIPLD